ncbi:unnamed protein product [Penicillium glandicola]
MRKLLTTSQPKSFMRILPKPHLNRIGPAVNITIGKKGSPNWELGCTTLFVALRCIVLNSYPWRSVTQNDRFRKLILSLTVWQDSWPDISRAIVRMLTFDALGLAHTCCIEIQEFKTVRAPYVPGEAMDETEVDMILDDQHFLHEFEELMEEMESKLDELGLPLEEFLDGYWYDRVIEYLSRRDYYDEEHVTEARRMGIFLEAEEFCIPDRISLQFRSRVQDLQDGSLSDEFQSYESSAMA